MMADLVTIWILSNSWELNISNIDIQIYEHTGTIVIQTTILGSVNSKLEKRQGFFCWPFGVNHAML